MQISKLHTNKRAMKALTGVSLIEFQKLLPDFEQALHDYYVSKEGRKRSVGGGKKGHLKTAQDKLFLRHIQRLMYWHFFQTKAEAALVKRYIHICIY